MIISGTQEVFRKLLNSRFCGNDAGALRWRNTILRLFSERQEGAMKEIIADSNLVAYCGLYCGACNRYRKEKCFGCREHTSAAWCKVRTCCRTEGYQSCADCRQYQDVQDCGWYNNIMAKIFGFIFRSDRAACIRQIREIGIRNHAMAMADMKQRTIRR